MERSPRTNMSPQSAGFLRSSRVAWIRLPMSVSVCSCSVTRPMFRKAHNARTPRTTGTMAYTLSSCCQVSSNNKAPVATGPATSPMLPPTPWTDNAMPRRWAKW